MVDPGVICLDFYLDLSPALVTCFSYLGHPHGFTVTVLNAIASSGLLIYSMLIKKNSDHAEKHEEGGKKHFYFYKPENTFVKKIFLHLFIFERQRESISGGRAERERGTESEAGSRL